MSQRQSLATKYRPNEFSEICGQSITVKILEKAIENRTFKNVYLFAGSSGCGKTTLARCFANKINRGQGNPIEIDAASNNGVDNVRALVESANQRSLDSEFKIFIIDECHMITREGWNAFLKGIEEPAPYTIYIFCTTEPNKIPATILNRVQRYNITKIDAETIKNRLVYICEKEGFTNYTQTCDLISKLCGGCMRDAITYLDQCSDYSTDLKLDNTKLILNNLSFEPLFALTWALQEKDEAKIFEVIDGIYTSGTDLKNFIDNYIDFSLDLTKYILFKNISITNIPEYLATTENPVVQQTIDIPGAIKWFNSLTDILLEIKLNIKYDTSYKSTIEAYLLKFCRGVK